MPLVKSRIVSEIDGAFAGVCSGRKPEVLMELGIPVHFNFDGDSMLLELQARATWALFGFRKRRAWSIARLGALFHSGAGREA